MIRNPHTVSFLEGHLKSLDLHIRKEQMEIARLEERLTKLIEERDQIYEDLHTSY